MGGYNVRQSARLSRSTIHGQRVWMLLLYAVISLPQMILLGVSWGLALGPVPQRVLLLLMRPILSPMWYLVVPFVYRALVPRSARYQCVIDVAMQQSPRVGIKNPKAGQV